MEKIDILLWAIGGGFAGTWAIIFYLLREMREFRNEMNAMREDIRDIDRRLCRMEGAFMNKECCMIKDDRIKQKAE